MKFCAQCKNMLYTFAEPHDGEETLLLKCRTCSYTEPASSLIYSRNLREDSATKMNATPYLINDPTLPRFTTIPCANPSCSSRKGAGDVVGVKIDEKNLVWMYQCAICKTSWKQAARI